MGLRRLSASLLLISVAASACSPTSPSDPVAASACVDIPEGQYFQWVNGRLIGTDTIDQARERPPETARRIGITLAGMGYPWIVLNYDGRVARIGGLAPSELARTDAFIAAKAAFEADPVSRPSLQDVVNEIAVREFDEAIAPRLTQRLAVEGFSWLRIVMVDKVALLVGEAANGEIKQAGYRKGRALIESDPAAAPMVNVIVDVIKTPAEARPVGSAFRNLPEEPSQMNCENAFFDTMAGRKIEFLPDQAIIDNSSARLLDAVAAVAQRCHAFEIEIGQHAGNGGNRQAVLDLTRRQASAIRDYLSAYGVNREALTATGYGRTRPIDRSGTAQASERNRRTEFSITGPRED